MIAGVAHKQVELRWDDPDGRDVRSVVWLPSGGLYAGQRLPGAVILTVYDAILIRCPGCQRLCGRDVVKCHCEKKG